MRILTAPHGQDAPRQPGADSGTEVFETLESEVRSYSRRFPAVFATARGAVLTDETGREYLDFFCGSGALNLGHNPPALKARLLEYLAADGLTHGLDLFTVAKRDFLTALRSSVLAPRGLSHKVQFCGPTGTNAVEAALKLARKATGRSTVVSFYGGFHGVSGGSLAVTGDRATRAAAGTELHHTVFVPYPDGPTGEFDSVGLLERMVADTSSGVQLPAAVILEPVQSDGGIYCATPEFLRALREFTERHGILLIADEIWTGCGRTGDFFGFEESGIVPDLITLSKSISGYGLPLSLLLIAPHLDVWAPGEHSGTFRGNQLAFVTGAAALRYWSDQRFLDQLSANAVVLSSWADQVRSETGLAVRGRGPALGVDTADPRWADRVQRRCFERGLVIERCGRRDEVLRVLPPLTIGLLDLDRGLALLLDAIQATAPDRPHQGGLDGRD
ncbi:aspartate aminotransferase family protein [Kitasatospora sp. NPDC051853]|uniref:aspartate aminotransferase family protein n=1 Tax=Kitasatospora sp. NPDC051853 TaxID=3364058 RepID=UPI0037AA2B8B